MCTHFWHPLYICVCVCIDYVCMYVRKCKRTYTNYARRTFEIKSTHAHIHTHKQKHTNDARCKCDIKAKISMAGAAFNKKKLLVTSKLT